MFGWLRRLFGLDKKKKKKINKRARRYYDSLPDDDGQAQFLKEELTVPEKVAEIRGNRPAQTMITASTPVKTATPAPQPKAAPAPVKPATQASQPKAAPIQTKPADTVQKTATPAPVKSTPAPAVQSKPTPTPVKSTATVQKSVTQPANIHNSTNNIEQKTTVASVKPATPAPIKTVTPAPQPKVAPAPVKTAAPVPQPKAAPAPVKTVTPAPQPKAAPAPVKEEIHETKETVMTSKTGSTGGKFDIKRTKDDRYVFNLYASNHVIIATSQTYTTSGAAMNGIRSIIANAERSPIEDQTLKNYVALPYPKWEMYVDRGGQYRFRLNAPNGSCIVHSQGYTSKSSCKRGIDSIIRFATDAEIAKSYLKKD